MESTWTRERIHVSTTGFSTTGPWGKSCGWQNINLWFAPKFFWGSRLFPFGKIIWKEPEDKYRLHCYSAWNSIKAKMKAQEKRAEMAYKWKEKSLDLLRKSSGKQRGGERVGCHWEGGIAFWAVTSHLDLLHHFSRSFSLLSLTHACLSEFLWWKLKQLCFTFGMGLTQTTQEEAGSQRGRGDSESNVRLVHPREM